MPRTSSVERRLMSASTLIGEKVVNVRGEELGKIEDIMLDLDGTRVGYAVLSFGGWLGMGDKLFAVPWETLILDSQRKAFIFNVSREVLEKAPGFDRDHWPDTINPDWENEVQAHFGAARGGAYPEAQGH
jgi:sporulation protein YlmC with PRC-barrel domain